MHYLPIAQTLVGSLCTDEPYGLSDKARVVIFLKLFIIIWGQTKSVLESAWHWQKDSFLSFIFTLISLLNLWGRCCVLPNLRII